MLLKKIIQFAAKSNLGNLSKPIRKYLPASIRVLAKENRVTPLVSVEELRPQIEKACNYLTEIVGKDKLGDYLEFGVCHGTSMNCMNQVLQQYNLGRVRLFGFDSFEGMPVVTKHEDGDWYPGQFKSEMDETSYFLTQRGIDWEKTVLTKGWFSDTLTEDFKVKNNIQKASLIMIDCDIYSAAKESLNFCKSLIVDKAIIIFDDWNSDDLAEKHQGEKKAFTEFMQDNPHLVSEEFGDYHYRGKPNGKLFVVTNTKAYLKRVVQMFAGCTLTLPEEVMSLTSFLWVA